MNDILQSTTPILDKIASRSHRVNRDLIVLTPDQFEFLVATGNSDEVREI